ncbi:hypothetical protein [Chryseosolibacter indicus]|uniref:Outer membrane protein beta-barrel domain-containing protein n=1 Tax=Chryseosolibacter indicus TaxID=2782351 RepID=A0ABS5VWF3_9BACT|nr:hypothetical protein [Chryseosolibacter indicus]MBT1705744.1 hypothetical protein [Chryseosolibacter indicus]
MKYLILISSFCFSYNCIAQSAKDFIIGTQLDLIKSDYDVYFSKAQAGLEVNYFITEQYTATAGLEIWTDDETSAVVGMRWYPIVDGFIRLRGLIGANDVSIGGGWAKPFSETWRVEAITDFYFEGNFSIRVGLAYLFRKKKY